MSKYQLMPPLTDEEYRALKDDIRVRGVLVAVEYDDLGNPLAGHHRLRIIEELRAEGIPVDYTSIIRPGLTEHQKRSHVRAINLQRRHLNNAQRRALIADQLRDTPDVSDREIARGLGVTGKTVGATRRRLENIEELPRFPERRCAGGRRYPSVVANNSRETQRALEALAGLNANVLPAHPMPVKVLERIRRETDSAQRAIGVEADPSIVGGADIRVGDFRKVLGDIPDGTADLILTDPPYAKEYLALWDDLGAFAARVLRPGGLLVAYSGQTHLPRVLSSLCGSLEYVWVISQVGRARTGHDYNRQIWVHWKPVVVLAKAPFTPVKWWDDILRGDGPEKNHHDWQQAEGEARRLVEMFSQPGDLVIDPMLGGGTTAAASVALGRRLVGCDTDPIAVSTSRDRVRQVLECHE